MSESIQAIANNNYILHNIDAKKLYVQEPLFTANSGDAVYVGWRPDETVLLNNAYVNQSTTSFTVSEPLSNFQKIRFEGLSHNSTVVMDEHLAPSGNENIYVMETYFCPNGDNNPWQCRMGAYKTTNGLTYTGVSAKFIYMGFNSTTINGDTGNFPVINKIIGINRKENA